MSISAPFIARPIATWLLAIAILLGGLLGYQALPVSALPQVDFPTIEVSTQLPGASPQTISTLITASLERQLGEIPGLASMTSMSSEGTSQITLQFNLDRNIDSASQDVQAAINAAAGTLPANLPYPPTYSKVNPADAPILTLALTSDSIPIPQVSDAADTLLQPKLAEIDGVGKVTVEGGLRPAVRVRVDPARLAAAGVSMEDVRTAIANANTNGAKGGFDGERMAVSLGANDQLVNADQYKDLVIAWRNNAPVKLSAVGSVIGGVENDRVGAWYFSHGRREQAAVLDIQRQPGANIVQTVERVKQALPALQHAIPAGIRISFVTDRTETIRASVRDVQITLVMAVVLVVLVIFAFLRSPRATFIPAVALPLSLIGTFGVMHLLGYSLDNLSLMALTVATGFVVDDAIVMIENIVRYIESGVPPLEAAYRGAGQIGFTIVSLTVSLIAVFIPLLFMTGVVGRLFSEFAVTLSVAVVVSAVVSLTLTPMMCGRILRPLAEQHPGLLARTLEGGFDRLLGGYRRTLRLALRHQTLVLLVALGTLAGHRGTLSDGAQGVSAAAGYRRADGRDGGGAGCLHPAPVRHAESGRGTNRRRCGGNGGGFVCRRRHDQRHAQYRAVDHRAEADRAAQRGGGGDRAAGAAGDGDSRADRVVQAGAGYYAGGAGQPHRVSIHAAGYGCGGAGGVDAEAGGAAGGVAAIRRGDVGPAERGGAVAGHRRSAGGDAPGRDHAGDRGHAVRRVRAAAGLHDFRAGEPVSRDTGIRPELAGRPEHAAAAAGAGNQRRAGAAGDGCDHPADAGTAGSDA